MNIEIQSVVSDSPLSEEMKTRLLESLGTDIEEVFWEKFQNAIVDEFRVVAEKYQDSLTIDDADLQKLEEEMVTKKEAIEKELDTSEDSSEALQVYVQKMMALEEEHTERLKNIVSKE